MRSVLTRKSLHETLTMTAAMDAKMGKTMEGEEAKLRTKSDSEGSAEEEGSEEEEEDGDEEEQDEAEEAGRTGADCRTAPTRRRRRTAPTMD